MKKLEDSNYKVDSTGREVKEFTGYVKGEEVKIKAKVSPEGDIREYVSGVPEELIGEQLFTYNALCRLGVEKRLPSFEDIKEIEDINLAGYWNPNNKTFYNIGERSNVWLADGNNAYFSQNKWNRLNNYRNYGFSGRLLKELNQSDNLTIGLFEKIVERAERYGAKLGAKAGYELGKILSTTKSEDETK